MKDGIHNARITRTTLGTEPGRPYTWWLHLDYGGLNQGFGGYGLSKYNSTSDTREPSICFGIAVMGILETLDVEKWEDLPGKPCRVILKDGLAHAIGHYLRDQWFTPSESLTPKTRSK